MDGLDSGLVAAIIAFLALVLGAGGATAVRRLAQGRQAPADATKPPGPARPTPEAVEADRAALGTAGEAKRDEVADAVTGDDPEGDVAALLNSDREDRQ